MRRTLACITLAALLVVGLLDCVRAEEPEVTVSNTVSDAALARLAHRLLQGDDGELEGALAQAQALDAATLRRLILEMRDQVRIRAAMERCRIQNLAWEQMDLDAVSVFLRTVTGVRFTLSPKVRARHLAEIRVSLHLDGVSVSTLLALVTEPYGLYWLPQGGVVHIVTTEELSDDAYDWAGDDDDTIALRAKIKATQVSLSVDHQSFAEVLELLRAMTGSNIHIDPRIESEVGSVQITSVFAEDMSLETLLNLLQAMAGEGIVWITRGNVIIFTHRKFVDK